MLSVVLKLDGQAGIGVFNLAYYFGDYLIIK